jgi:hypothetical protein
MLPGMGLLEHLSEALAGAVDSPDRRRDLLLSGLAMIVICGMLGLVARWMLRGGLSNGWAAVTEPRRYGNRNGEGEALYWLTLGGGGLAFVALILVLGGLVSLAAVLRPRD